MKYTDNMACLLYFYICRCFAWYFGRINFVIYLYLICMFLHLFVFILYLLVSFCLFVVFVKTREAPRGTQTLRHNSQYYACLFCIFRVFVQLYFLLLLYFYIFGNLGSWHLKQNSNLGFRV